MTAQFLRPDSRPKNQKHARHQQQEAIHHWLGNNGAPTETSSGHRSDGPWNFSSLCVSARRGDRQPRQDGQIELLVASEKLMTAHYYAQRLSAPSIARASNRYTAAATFLCQTGKTDKTKEIRLSVLQQEKTVGPFSLVS